MRELLKRTRFRRWAVPALLVAFAVAVVLAAPLASPNRASAGVVIAGARSLSDQVSVTYRAHAQGQTTDVHVLAFNDLHGNLQPAALNIYAKFAGGAAFLAKAVKDK
jgi:5'-nucleotidase